MAILEQAIDIAQKNKISTIVVASTSGETALKLFKLVRDIKIRMIVVTHDEGSFLKGKRFSEDIRKKLSANNITIYTHNPCNILLRKITDSILERFGFPSWNKHLREIREKYGTGIKVCNIIVQMLIEDGILKEGKVVAVAGKQKGADSAATFLIEPQNKWPFLEKIISDGGKNENSS